MTRHTVLFVALMLVVGACGAGSESAETSPPPPGATSATPTTALAFRFVTAACEFDPAFGAEVDCGWLEVPENRADPDNHQTIRLHVARYAATVSTPEPDPVLYLFGGPGDPGVDISNWLHTRLVQLFTDRRDVIVIDQRGSGYSEPLLTCPEGVEAEYDALDETLTRDEEVQRIIDGYATCRDRLTANGVDLTAYNTTQNAADIGDLMEAMGYAHYNLFGVSYGSRVALTVLRHHPERIRSMVLDSVLPPDVDPTGEGPEIAAEAVSAFFAECAANESCGPDYPDLEQRFWELVERLDVSPVTIHTFPPQGGTSHDVIVDGDLLIESVTVGVTRPELIAQIPKRIATAHGGDDSALEFFVEIVLGMLDESYPVALNISTGCHEQAPFIDSERFDAAVAATGRLGEAFDTPDDIARFCEMWQAGVADAAEHVPVASDVPVLAMQGGFDAFTPTRWAHHAAASLPNAVVVEFPAHGHWVTLDHVCPREVARRFVTDPGTDVDTSCIEMSPPIRFWPPPSSG